MILYFFAFLYRIIFDIIMRGCDDVEVRTFNVNDKKMFLDFVSEVRDYDNNFEGFKVGNIDDFDLFLEKVNDGKKKKENDFSPQITYGVFDDNCLIGAFSLRLELVGCLINHGGNIGYFVRPSKRKMGYGTKILKCALKEALKYGLDRVLITCRVDNIGSSKVIIKNGGILENIYYDSDKNEKIYRYWINLKG